MDHESNWQNICWRKYCDLNLLLHHVFYYIALIYVSARRAIDREPEWAALETIFTWP